MDQPEDRFASGTWTAGVIGLGYVGLPLAVTASEVGLGSIGFDVSERRVAAINDGRSPVGDVSDDALAAALERGMEVTADVQRLADADAIFICVPSPLGRNREPDLSYIKAAADSIEQVVRPGQLISLESTTYPGTTEDYLLPAIERAGLKLDDDVWVAFSPERVSPGDDLKTAEIPKVVGGVTAESTRVAVAAYRRLVPSVHAVSDSRTAEMAKLLENTYRAVNIGLINEMAQLAHELDIDIWEVVEAAATKPFGFQAFWPGPGVGGHCIPLDPQFLAWRAREANFATRFIDLAEQVNSKMPAYTVTRISDLLNRAGRPTFGSRILAVGVSYKPNVADARESASIQVVEELQRKGAVVEVYDPVVGDEDITRMGFVPASLDEVQDYDAVVILTDHAVIDYDAVAKAKIVFDTRGVMRRLGFDQESVSSL